MPAPVDAISELVQFFAIELIRSVRKSNEANGNIADLSRPENVRAVCRQLLSEAPNLKRSILASVDLALTQGE